MPLYRELQQVVRRYRGDREILESYRGAQRVYSSLPDPLLFAEFTPGALLANSGTSGGSFTQSGVGIASRAPRGVWIPNITSLSKDAAPYGSGFTVMGWIKSSRALSGASPLRIQSLNGLARFNVVQTSAPGSGSFTVAPTLAGSGGNFLVPGVNARLGEWFHVCLVMGKRTDSDRTHPIKFYVNGELKLTESMDGLAIPGPQDLHIGDSWEGDVGLVRMFTKPLRASQVRDIFDAEKAIYEPGPVSHYFNRNENSQDWDRHTWTTLESAVVVGSGTASIYAGWRFGSMPVNTVSHLRAIEITVNGTRVGYWDHGGTKVMAGSWEDTGGVTPIDLSQGDFVELRGYVDNSSSALRTITYRWLEMYAR